MIVSMLKAISKMLEHSSTTEIGTFKARVSCAKIMLDQIIEGLKADKDTITTGSLEPNEKGEQVPVKPTKPKIPKGKPGEHKIVVDASRKIVKIENLPLDAKVEIDGKVMTHQEAIGKRFTSGRIL